MVPANLAVGSTLFVFSLRSFVSRPLSNSALALLGDGTPGWQTLGLVAVGVSAFLFFLKRLRSLQHEDASNSDQTLPEGEWNAAPEATVSKDRSENLQPSSADQTADQQTASREHSTGQQTADETDSDQQPSDDSQEPPDGTVPEFLTGQGGARDKGFEIEQRAPDASLSDHLEHLRAELDDPDSQRDLDRLEDLVEETEDETEIPPRCPQEHCPAAWSERRIIGREAERYERLDDDRILCLECETVHTLE